MNDFWNERYCSDAYKFGTAPADFMTREAHWLTTGSTVLSVADGEGRNSVWLAEQGHQVVAFDAASRGVEKAHMLAEARGVTVDFHLSTIEDWDWSKTFDAVLAIFIQFLSPAQRSDAFAKIAQTIRPGGLLLLHGYAPRQIENGTGGPPHRENLYTEEMLESAFAGWQVLVSRDYDAELSEGDGHKGPSALIDFVARKPT